MALPLAPDFAFAATFKSMFALRALVVALSHLDNRHELDSKLKSVLVEVSIDRGRHQIHDLGDRS